MNWLRLTSLTGSEPIVGTLWDFVFVLYSLSDLPWFKRVDDFKNYVAPISHDLVVNLKLPQKLLPHGVRRRRTAKDGHY